jgi:hypothetical protein
MAVTPELFKRTRYFGLRTADPAIPGLQVGAWWFNTIENRLKYFDGTTIIAIGKPFLASNTLVVATSGDYTINVTITGITLIEQLINIQLDTDPKVSPGVVVGPGIDTTVVGFTLMGVGGGTTITATVRTVGY